MNYTVKNSSGVEINVDAESVIEDNQQTKVTFLDAEEEPVASFRGYQEWYPTPS